MRNLSFDIKKKEIRERKIEKGRGGQGEWTKADNRNLEIATID